MIKYRYGTIEELHTLVNVDKEVFFDTETDGLYGQIFLAQFYQEDWEEVIMVQKPVLFDLMILLAKCYIVMQNSSYDISTIQRQSGIVWVPERFEDTLYLARLHFYEKEKFSLDNLIEYVLRYSPYDKAGLNKTTMQKSDWSGTLTEDQQLYASLDVYHLPDVYNTIKKSKEDYLYQLDMVSLKEALVWQNNGFSVDKEALDKHYITNKQLIAEEQLPINCNSYVQVRKYIGSNNSDGLGLAMEEYKGNERAARTRKVRKLEKQQSFIRKFDTDDSKIYGLFAPSARSGRYTCKKQNLQQIPRKLKHLFGLEKGSDKVLVFSDYPQLEIRAVCAVTRETKMEKLLREGEDLHAFVAEMIFGSKFTKEQRQISKTANFALLYGASHIVLGSILLKDDDLYMPEKELKNIKVKWNRIWSILTDWQQDGIQRWRAGMIGQTPLGRKYKAKMMTDYLNIQIQGFGAEIAKIAMHYMIDEVKEKGWYNKEVKFVNFIHDSYYFEVDNNPEIYEEIAKIMARCMQTAWFASCVHIKIPDLPMPIEVLVGHNVKGLDNGDHIYKYELEGMHYYNKEGEY